jgi:flagellar secretion chaperone FliS
MDARFQYREATVRGASPLRLVVCLYEQAIQDLRQAALELVKGNIEARTRKINHAITVIGQLQGTLDMERGREVARNLELFYNTLRSGLIEAQSKQSLQILEHQIAQLVLVYEAWLEVERTTADATRKTPEAAAPGPSTPVEDASSADWSA